MTSKEFSKKYGFPKPKNTRERHMLIMSNLSDIQFFNTDKDTHDRINNLKSLIINLKNEKRISKNNRK